jgi:hypothetical protein
MEMTPTSQLGFVVESKVMGFAAAQGRHVAGAHQAFVRMCYPCSMESTPTSTLSGRRCTDCVRVLSSPQAVLLLLGYSSPSN